MRRNLIRLLTAIAVITALLAGFQNCTARFQTTSGEQNAWMRGNGDGYEGKTYYSQARCADGSSESAILYSPAQPLLIRDNCADLTAPVALDPQLVTVNSPTEIAYAGEIYSLTNAWLKTSDTGAPAPRSHMISVWTGNEMIVWGGINENYWINSGGRYNPNTDTWTSIPNGAGSPPAQVGSAYAWTGTDLIVWSGSALRQDGFKYNPASNSWSPISSVGAPQAVHGASSVWTGTEMIVWGGRNAQGNTVNTGGRYNPATDTWTPLAVAGAPPGAFFEQSTVRGVWTGTEMIVWGGVTAVGPYQFTNTGGRYNPATNSWRPISMVGAPSVREGFTPIWTGSELIIWGGHVGTSYNDGALYNPVSDTWRPISMTGAPSPRDNYSAVWTGSKMIVWSGHQGSLADFNDGAIYDPALDTWTPITSQDRPTGRWGGAMVWTGDRAVMWGGATAGWAPYFNSGAIYFP